MTTHMTKTWFDGDEFVKQHIPESEIYKREWVGLDHHDKKKFSSWLDHKTDDEVFTAIEARLKELNT